MTERCPLSEFAPGFVYEEAISDICRINCESRWEAAIASGMSDHEEYPSSILRDDVDCVHYATEYGSSSLQAVAVNSSERFYGITERCMSCGQEIAEDSFKFDCPNP